MEQQHDLIPASEAARIAEGIGTRESILNSIKSKIITLSSVGRRYLYTDTILSKDEQKLFTDAATIGEHIISW